MTIPRHAAQTRLTTGDPIPIAGQQPSHPRAAARQLVVRRPRVAVDSGQAATARRVDYVKRESLIPRADWPQKMEAVGFGFHSIDGIYWDERACYQLTAGEVDMLEAATVELHQMCIDAAEHVIDHKLYDKFAIPPEWVSEVERSWNDDDWTLFGRFDLSWDGRSAPKMLEYNADTPTSLIEASVAQWYWQQEVKPDADQFNSIHEKLIAQWQRIRADMPSNALYLACIGESEEDVGNLDYMADVATQAGLEPRFIDVAHIGWDAVGKCFVDETNRKIETLFKLYPWEWLTREAFGRNLMEHGPITIEPPWKMLLSNKAILPILWQLFPDHPNLLPAYFEPQKFATDFVKKPLLSREGANVAIESSQGAIATPGEYGAEGFIYQAYHPLPNFSANGEANYMVVGSWIIGDEAAGIGIREDESPITKNTSRFVPHYFI
jgi:glutathionylspermidine synthase